MKQVIYGESLQRDPVWYARAQQAMAFLETISARRNAEVVAECELISSPAGQHLELTLIDPTRSVAIELRAEHFINEWSYRSWLHQLWGDWLQLGLEKSVEQLMVATAASEE